MSLVCFSSIADFFSILLETNWAGSIARELRSGLHVRQAASVTEARHDLVLVVGRVGGVQGLDLRRRGGEVVKRLGFGGGRFGGLRADGGSLLRACTLHHTHGLLPLERAEQVLALPVQLNLENFYR